MTTMAMDDNDDDNNGDGATGNEHFGYCVERSFSSFSGSVQLQKSLDKN